MLHVAVITSTRAEWGLLRPVAEAIRSEPALRLSIFATGSHLSPAFGNTVDEITRAGFDVTERVPALADGDDARAVTRSLANVTAGFADLFAARSPDILLVPGDRYEMLGVAGAALIARLPVAHLFGGDVTEGAFDEAIRHSITKMAHVHLVTTEEAGRRVRQLGEDPAHVHVVGSPGLDVIRTAPRVPREEVFRRVGLAPREKLALVTFHPPTLDEAGGPEQMRELLAALDGLGDDTAILLTGSNADTKGREMSRLAAAFAADRPRAAYRDSLGHELYLSALAAASVVIGNSSSGLYEAPSFAIPTVNIGDRQRGRTKARSVIDCAPGRNAIAAALATARELDCSDVVNPYGDGHASARIASILKHVGNPRRLLKKTFFDLPGE